MIRIVRNRTDSTGTVIAPPPIWFQQSGVATGVALGEGTNHIADRSIYGHDHVRAALEALFHDKCAYCESKVSASSDWNVDHFRPKGRVAENRNHPGYYWLTYTWENLYPACIFCNQNRRDRPRWGDLRYGITGGKADQFPLEDETTRAMGPGENINLEMKLLIEPCQDDPSLFLTFGVDGEVLAVADNIRGSATIQICNLNRKRLKDARRETVEATIEILGILQALEIANRMEESEQVRSRINQHLMQDYRAYSAVRRSVQRDPSSFGL